MRDHGVNPREVYLAAIEDGYDDIEAIRALRRIFNLSLQEARETISQAKKDQQRRAA
jgi:ribosomal protein L7/L12